MKYVIKKYLIAFGVVLVLSLSLYAVSHFLAMPSGPKIHLDESERFTDEEVQEAALAVLAKFDDFKGCKLLRLWYDEAASDKYLSYETEEVSMENTIVLYSDFRSPKQNSGAWNPNEIYGGWSWTLTRENKESPWQVVNYGYA